MISLYAVVGHPWPASLLAARCNRHEPASRQCSPCPRGPTGFPDRAILDDFVLTHRLSANCQSDDPLVRSPFSLPNDTHTYQDHVCCITTPCPQHRLRLIVACFGSSSPSPLPDLILIPSALLCFTLSTHPSVSAACSKSIRKIDRARKAWRPKFTHFPHCLAGFQLSFSFPFLATTLFRISPFRNPHEEPGDVEEEAGPRHDHWIIYDIF